MKLYPFLVPGAAALVGVLACLPKQAAPNLLSEPSAPSASLTAPSSAVPGKTRAENPVHSSAQERFPGMESLLAEYQAVPEKELQDLLNGSKRELFEMQLIEKSNQGRLSRNERSRLLLELRKQRALSLELTRKKLRRLQEKYL